MAQTAEYYENAEARLVTGRLLDDADDSGCRVVCGNAALEARLAASCLMRPQKGDTVLLAELEDETLLVLAVLFSARQSQARFSLPAESSLDCPGNLTVRCARSLEMQSGRELGLRAENLAVTAQNGDVRIAEVRAVSDMADICCRALSTLGGTALSVFKSLTQCLGSSRRVIEGEDETRAGNSTLLVTENATVMSKNGLTLAEETARTDAKLIQLG
ncbi:MAG: DUF3540 domain-containing protein [Desulfovibrio sp.]|jgi:hypothetical protein|nr:DUF3540 domain-containing protein [Desulfovibrio sp.]